LRSLVVVGLTPPRPPWAHGHDSGIYTFERLRALADEAAHDLKQRQARRPGT